MKQTLYISDLDGTLLSSEGTLTPFAVTTINRFIAQGGLFSIATGRSTTTGLHVLEPLALTLPVAFSNGTVLYDPLEKRLMSVTQIPRDSLLAVETLLEQHELAGFLYLMNGATVESYHTALRTPFEEAYQRFRAPIYKNAFHQTNSLVASAEQGLPFICVVYGAYDTLTELAETINHLGALHTSLYLDVYNPGYYMMDIYSSEVSKLTAMKMIQRIARAERTVSFGDGQNDIPMLEGANESYAPQNASEEVRAVVTKVIGANSEDSVAHFLAALC